MIFNGLRKEHSPLFGVLMGMAWVGLLFLFGWLFMLLWNWLMPAVFSFGVVTYWQALGILVMAKLLFGMPFRGRRMPHRRKPFSDEEWKRHVEQRLRHYRWFHPGKHERGEEEKEGEGEGVDRL